VTTATETWGTCGGYGCTGTIIPTERDGDFLIARCDHCGTEVSAHMVHVDPELRKQRLLKTANLPRRYDGAPFQPCIGHDDALAHIELLLARWGTDDPLAPPMLVGPNGGGKTRLLTHMAKRLIDRHVVHVRYFTVREILNDAKRRMDEGGNVQEVFDVAASVPLLILDDLGPGLKSEWAQGALEELLDQRYRLELPLAGATNEPAGAWPGVLGARIASRLGEMAMAVQVEGKDWRLT